LLARQRQEHILERVRREGSARVNDLTASLNVSDMTIRRDLDVLARRGLIDKVHGGATLRREPSTDEPGFAAKSRLEIEQKSAIADYAASLVRPGSAVALSGGTTTWLVAQRLREIPGLTVVTNSIRVVEIMDPDATDQNVILTGGVRTPSDALVGPVAIQAIRSLHVDLLLLGTHGIDADRGLTTPNLLESETNRAMIQAANRLIVVADSTKWGIVGLSTFAELDQVDILVTDDGLPESGRTHLEEHVGELYLVDSVGRAEHDREETDEEDHHQAG